MRAHSNPNDLSALRALLSRKAGCTTCRQTQEKRLPGQQQGSRLRCSPYVVGVRPNSVTFMQPNSLPMNLILGKTVEN
jgi:hypothetical protein